MFSRMSDSINLTLKFNLQVMQHQKQTASVKTRLLVSWVYMIDFLNLDEDGGERTRFRVALFYAVVFIENVLLVSLWSTNIRKD